MSVWSHTQEGADYVKSLGPSLSSSQGPQSHLSNSSHILTWINTMLMPISPSPPPVKGYLELGSELQHNFQAPWKFQSFLSSLPLTLLRSHLSFPWLHIWSSGM